MNHRHPNSKCRFAGLAGPSLTPSIPLSSIFFGLIFLSQAPLNLIRLCSTVPKCRGLNVTHHKCRRRLPRYSSNLENFRVPGALNPIYLVTLIGCGPDYSWLRRLCKYRLHPMVSGPHSSGSLCYGRHSPVLSTFQFQRALILFVVSCFSLDHLAIGSGTSRFCLLFAPLVLDVDTRVPCSCRLTTRSFLNKSFSSIPHDYERVFNFSLFLYSMVIASVAWKTCGPSSPLYPQKKILASTASPAKYPRTPLGLSKSRACIW